MALARLAAGDSITADHLNDLFEVADAKFAGLLNGKSPFLLVGHGANGSAVAESFAGRIFYFLGGQITPAPVVGIPFAGGIPNFGFYSGQTGRGFVDYNHQTFTDAAGTPAISTDDQANTATILIGGNSPFFTAADLVTALPGEIPQVPLLDWSLEAHKQGSHWVMEQGAKSAQRKTKYAVADLVYAFGGIGQQAQPVIQFPDHWNKYECIRIHNFNDYPILWQLLDANDQVYWSVTVLPYGCKAVRLDRAAGTAIAPWNYFFPFRSDDPRFLSFRGSPNGSSVYASMAVNNLSNPGFLHTLLRSCEGDAMDGITFIRDPHGVDDVYPQYASLFGDPSDPDTLIGDVLYHTGELTLVSEDDTVTGIKAVKVPWNGFARIGDIAGAGLTVTAVDRTYSLSGGPGTLMNDLAGTGTNLLRQGDFHRSIADLAGGVSIYNRLPFSGSPAAPAVKVPNVVDAALPDMTSYVLQFTAVPEPPVDVDLGNDTVGEILTLDYFGDPLTKSQNQNEWTRIEGMELDEISPSLVMTMFGPQVQFTQRIALTVPVTGGIIGGNGSFNGNFGSIDGTDLVRKLVVTFDNYGWPTEAAPGFLTPRQTRAYSRRVPFDGGIYSHPDINHEAGDPLGADFDLTAIQMDSSSGFTALCPAQIGDGANTTFSVWGNPDMLLVQSEAIAGELNYNTIRTSTLLSKLFGGGFALGPSQDALAMPRVYLLIEIYNAWAAALDAIMGAVPYTFRHFSGLEPNLNGVFGTAYCPKEQYAAVGKDDTTCKRFGIPIRTDLPPSFTAAKNALPTASRAKWTQRIITSRIVKTAVWPIYIDDPNRFPGNLSLFFDNQTFYDQYVRSEDVGFTFPNESNDSARSPYSYALPEPAPFFWVSIEDVKTAAESAGFLFLFQQLSVPLILATETGLLSKLQDIPPSSPDILLTSSWYYPNHPGTPSTNPLFPGSGNGYPFAPVAPGGIVEENPSSFSTDGTRSIFREGDGEWKGAFPADRRVTGYSKGDFLTFLAGDAGVPTMVLKQDFSAPFLEAFRGDCVQNGIQYFKAALFQCRASDEISVGSELIQIPTSWLGHTTRTFSADSLANALLKLDGRPVPATAIPLLANKPSGGTTVISAAGNADTILTAADGQSCEIVQFLNDVVLL